MEKLFRHYAFVVLAAACTTSAFLLQLIDSSRHSLTKDSSLAVAVAFIVCAAGLLLALGSPAEMAPSCVTLAVAQMAALALGVQSVLLFQGGIAGAALGLCLRHGGGFPSTIGLVHGLTALFSLIAVVSVVSGLTSEKNVGLTVAWASVLFYVVNAFVFTPVEDEDPAEGEYASV
jgi:hypothetical protein